MAMIKCNFCKMSSPSGQCFWHSQIARENDCEKAVQAMIKAFSKDGKSPKNKRISLI